VPYILKNHVIRAEDKLMVAFANLNGYGWHDDDCIKHIPFTFHEKLKAVHNDVLILIVLQ